MNTKIMLACIYGVVMVAHAAGDNTCMFRMINKTNQPFTEMSTHTVVPVNASIAFPNQNCAQLKEQQKNIPSSVNKNGYTMSNKYYSDGSVDVTISGQAAKSADCSSCDGTPNETSVCNFSQHCSCLPCSQK